MSTRGQGTSCRFNGSINEKVKVPNRTKARSQMTLSRSRFCLFVFVVFCGFCLWVLLYFLHEWHSEAPCGGETVSAVSLSRPLLINPGGETVSLSEVSTKESARVVGCDWLTSPLLSH